MIARSYYVSVNSKPYHHPLPPSPGKPPGNLFERVDVPQPGQKESAKHRPLGQKNRAKTPPSGQLFLNIQQKKHKTLDRTYENQY